jgi:alpha-ketoglutarate-dependent taurine dioxygenase
LRCQGGVLSLTRDRACDYDKDANPAVMMVTNARQHGKPVNYLPDGEIFFHADSCFTECPQRAVCLYALELPSIGGDTIFASAVRLHDTLPPDIRDSPDHYRHIWQLGHLILWDNRRALHARPDFPADEPRKLRRVPIANDMPVVRAPD